MRKAASNFQEREEIDIGTGAKDWIFEGKQQCWML